MKPKSCHDKMVSRWRKKIFWHFDFWSNDRSWPHFAPIKVDRVTETFSVAQKLFVFYVPNSFNIIKTITFRQSRIFFWPEMEEKKRGRAVSRTPVPRRFREMARPRPVVEVSFCLDSLKLIFETRFLYNSLRLADYDETSALFVCCTAALLFFLQYIITLLLSKKRKLLMCVCCLVFKLAARSSLFVC